MESLPCEIVSKILSQLNVRDWIQCIQVSRSWFVMIPKAVSDIWNHVSIDKDTFPCLTSVRRFPSVQSISVDANHCESTLYAALQHVAACQVSFLELKQARIYSVGRFFKMLEILSMHLKSLTLNITSAAFMDFAHILNTCPHLFHFGYTSDIFVQFDPAKDHLSNLNFHPHLISLSLYTGQAHYDILSILQSCPNLKALKLDVVMPLDCRQILETLPQIEYLHIGSFSILADVVWEPREHEDGLWYLCLEYYKNNIVSNGNWALQKHHRTLRTLHVEHIDPDCLALNYDKLEVLSCRGKNRSHNNSSSRNSSRNSNRRAEGEANGDEDMSEGDSDEADLADLLNQCPNLQALDLCDSSGCLSQSIVNAILRLSSLKTASFLLVNQHETRVYRDQLVRSLAQLPQLTRLDIQIEYFEQRALNAISCIRTLQELYLESSRRSLGVSFDVLAAIQNLRFLGITRFGEFSVDGLVLLRRLETVFFEHCRSVANLLALIDRAPPRLREIILMECLGYDVSVKTLIDHARKQQVEITVHQKVLDHLRE
ncbi:hypothetical protein BX666DRAFT_1886944 [Dichotomocladium elegans]|nr:hypothetical protein BX666DRAFT_1886944 [Dichotomocladium elegans]